MQDKKLYEFDLLRAIACMSIVLLHSAARNATVVGSVNDSIYIRILLCGATPTFIMISIIILAMNYKESIPKGFWKKRILYIFLPYIFCAIIDAFIRVDINPRIVLSEEIKHNLFEASHVGWFIIVIMQLYLIFYLIKKFNFDMKLGSLMMFFIQFGYTTFIKLPLPFMKEHSTFLKSLFPAWVGYFAIAYFIGTYYKQIIEYLSKKKMFTLVLFIISLLIIYVDFKKGDVVASSRRIDLIPLVVSVTLLVIAWRSILPKLFIIKYISGCSFGIYLMHWHVQRYLAPYTAQVSDNTYIQIAVLFLTSLVASIIIVKLITSVKLGHFILGKNITPSLKQLKKNRNTDSTSIAN